MLIITESELLAAALRYRTPNIPKAIAPPNSLTAITSHKPKQRSHPTHPQNSDRILHIPKTAIAPPNTPNNRSHPHTPNNRSHPQTPPIIDRTPTSQKRSHPTHPQNSDRTPTHPPKAIALPTSQNSYIFP